MRRLNTLVRKLRKTDLLDEYDAVIREQLEEGVVEPAPAEVTGREFFLPHRAVVRRNAEMTKLRVVYDMPAKQGKDFKFHIYDREPTEQVGLDHSSAGHQFPLT